MSFSTNNNNNNTNSEFVTVLIPVQIPKTVFNTLNATAVEIFSNNLTQLVKNFVCESVNNHSVSAFNNMSNTNCFETSSFETFDCESHFVKEFNVKETVFEEVVQEEEVSTTTTTTTNPVVVDLSEIQETRDISTFSIPNTERVFSSPQESSCVFVVSSSPAATKICFASDSKTIGKGRDSFDRDLNRGGNIIINGSNGSNMSCLSMHNNKSNSLSWLHSSAASSAELSATITINIGSCHYHEKQHRYQQLQQKQQLNKPCKPSCSHPQRLNNQYLLQPIIQV